MTRGATTAALVCAAAAFLGGCATQGTGSAGAIETKSSGLERAITLLQMQARSGDAATRANCIEALQGSSDPRAAEVIEQGLHDREWVVRFAAAMATGKRKTPAYRPVLQEMAAKDTNDSVRVAAIYALRRMGDTGYMNTLAETLRSPDPAVRANTALVLGLMGDQTAIPLLKSIHAESESPVKFEITAALARLGDPSGQRIIAAQAISWFAEDQWTAMQVCADLPESVGANPLKLGLQYPKSTPAELAELTVRRQLVAARSLGRMHSAEGAQVAADHLKDKNPSLRALAALALGEILVPQDDSVVKGLIRDVEKAMADPDPVVQRSAAAAIVNMYSPKQK